MISVSRKHTLSLFDSRFLESRMHTPTPACTQSISSCTELANFTLGLKPLILHASMINWCQSNRTVISNKKLHIQFCFHGSDLTAQRRLCDKQLVCSFREIQALGCRDKTFHLNHVHGKIPLCSILSQFTCFCKKFEQKILLFSITFISNSDQKMNSSYADTFIFLYRSFFHTS